MSTKPPPKERSRLIVTIELDPVPGWGNTSIDHRKWLKETLESLIPHYHPLVFDVTGNLEVEPCHCGPVEPDDF